MADAGPLIKITLIKSFGMNTIAFHIKGEKVYIIKYTDDVRDEIFRDLYNTELCYSFDTKTISLKRINSSIYEYPKLVEKEDFSKYSDQFEDKLDKLFKYEKYYRCTYVIDFNGYVNLSFSKLYSNRDKLISTSMLWLKGSKTSYSRHGSIMLGDWYNLNLERLKREMNDNSLTIQEYKEDEATVLDIVWAGPSSALRIVKRNKNYKGTNTVENYNIRLEKYLKRIDFFKIYNLHKKNIEEFLGIYNEIITF